MGPAGTVVRVASVDVRPVRVADRAFLREVFASTRERELAYLPEAVHAQFLEFQFKAAETHRQRAHPGCSRSVIVLDGETAGVLYVDRHVDALQIVEIALLPRFRGRGAGTMLLGGLVREASQAGTPVTLQVHADNPARALYERLGFRQVEDRGIYLLMQRSPVS